MDHHTWRSDSISGNPDDERQSQVDEGKCQVYEWRSQIDEQQSQVDEGQSQPASGETAGSEPVEKRNKGEPGFGDIEENFEKMIAALGAVPGYVPPPTDLTLASLTTLATTYATKNLAMSTVGNQVVMKQNARLDGYDGPAACARI